MKCSSTVKSNVASTTPVAVVGGTGALGSALAARLAKAGVAVRIGSRKIESAAEAAAKIHAKLGDDNAPVSGHLNEDAAAGCEIVFLTVPFRAQSENLNNLRGVLEPGQILVDATVPLAAAISGKATRTIGVWQGSAAQQAAEMAPEGVIVVSALHTVSAVTLADLDQDFADDTLVMSDDKAAKAKVARVIELIPGLRAVDGGPLEQARVAEQITALLIGVNIRYKTHAGVRFTHLPDREW
ncbi:MAG: NADPH-dependent F420 reductase [Actinobacteria bacterium]|nr:NADPH-dependent F420 reductase [Actinomycetota bacterium]